MILTFDREMRFIVQQYKDGGDEREYMLDHAREHVADDDRAVDIRVAVVPHECAYECNEMKRAEGVRYCDDGYVTHDVLAKWTEEVEA